jgi:hypothetical protein
MNNDFKYDGKTTDVEYVEKRIEYEMKKMIPDPDTSYSELESWINFGTPMPLSKEECFTLCFLKPYKKNESYIKSLLSKYPINDDAYNRMLINTELEEFAYHLKIMGLNEINKKAEVDRIEENDILPFDNSNEIYSDKSTIENQVNENKEIIDTLIYLLENKNSTINIVLKSGNLKNNNFKTQNNQITEAFIEGLKLNLKEKGLNKDYLSYDEAKDEILKLKDIEWIENWLEKYLTENDMINYNNLEFSIDINKPEEYIDNDMINMYSEEHFAKKEITVEFLYHLYDQIKNDKRKKKAGAKPKNDNIASLAERLSYLIRLKRFLSQNEYHDISRYTIKNMDCRLIHDYLVFFGLIQNQKERKNTTTSPENYIKMLIKNYRANRKFIANENNMMHFLINSYKRNGIYPIH